MLNTLKFGAPIRLKNLAAAPAGPENAAAYYNSTNHQVAVYVDGAWDYLALGSEVDTLEGSMGAAITGDGSFNVAAFSTASFIDDATSFTNAFLQLDAAISATDANVTLQDAYDNGGAIVTAGEVDVAISGPEQLVVSATQGIKSNILEMYDAAASVTEYSQRRYYDAIVLTGNTTEVQSEFDCAIATWGGIIINYVITDTSNERRIGRLLVTHGTKGTTISDDYAETASLDLTWTAAISASTLEISSTRSDSTNLSMNAEVVRFQV